jgi:hypothetical protein
MKGVESVQGPTFTLADMLQTSRPPESEADVIMQLHVGRSPNLHPVRSSGSLMLGIRSKCKSSASCYIPWMPTPQLIPESDLLA